MIAETFLSPCSEEGRSGRWLAIASPGDLAGLWAIQRLAASVRNHLVMVTPAQLALAPRWEHRVGRQTLTSIRLANGVELRSEEICAVFNRLEHVEAPHWRNATANERQYVDQELQALVLSWLAGFRCPVVNSPTATGLAGPVWHTSLWRRKAAQLGLATLTYAENSEVGEIRPAPCAAQMQVLVVGDIVLGNAPVGVRDAARRLAATAGVVLMSAHFTIDAHGTPLFSSADLYPDLRPWGDPAVAALARALNLEATARVIGPNCGVFLSS